MFINALPLLTRFLVFFLLSPLAPLKQVSAIVKIAAAFGMTVLIAPLFVERNELSIETLVMQALQEAAIGYIIGFTFALLFEALAIGGEVIGTLLGFSPAALFDPLLGLETNLIARLFTLAGVTIFFAADCHHVMLRILAEPYSFTNAWLFEVGKDSSFIFSQMLEVSLVPLTLAFLVILVFFFGARLLPHFHFFSVGLPLQLVCALLIIAIAFTPMPYLIKDGVLHLGLNIKKFVTG